MANCGCGSIEATGCPDCNPTTVQLTGGCCTPITGISPGGCSTPNCGCGSSAVTPCTPYYQKVSMCPEDNKQTVYVQRISQVFKAKSSFAMPACGASIRVVFDGISDVAIGGWLWASGLGYLQIEGFNPYTQEIEVSNPCPESCGDQAAPGTPIPACTVFILSVPPCPSAGGGSGTLYPYLNAGFTAPAISACLVVTVTNVNGLSVNKNISILGGIYRISAISSATNITICNDGAGLAAGTVVNYQDVNGNLIVPLILIDNNPCLNTSMLSGVPLTCIAGVLTPVVGTATGQVFTYNASSEDASFQPIAFPALDCTVLTACLTLDPTLPAGTAYTVEVADTSIFTVAQLISVAGAGGFHVTQILNATQMRITPVTDPSVLLILDAGTSVCSANCCEVLQEELDETNEAVSDINLRLGTIYSWTPVPTINGGGVVSNVDVNEAVYSIVGPWIHFKISIAFDLASTGAGSNKITLSNCVPISGGVSDGTSPLYPCHSDSNGIAVVAFWRWIGVFDIFQAAIARWNNGPARVDIDGKFRRI